MRDILFKAKRVDNGGWVEGYYIKARNHWHNHGKHEDWIVTGACSNGGWFAINSRYAIVPETLCQFSGLYDKHGKRIWENDIVKVKHAILGREEEKSKTPRNAYGLHFEENERGLYGRWFYYRNYAVEYKAHGNSRGKYIVRNGRTNSILLILYF